MNLFYILFGITLGTFVIEPLLINFIYFTNIGLFIDLFLTKKNENKLIEYIRRHYE